MTLSAPRLVVGLHGQGFLIVNARYRDDGNGDHDAPRVIQNDCVGVHDRMTESVTQSVTESKTSESEDYDAEMGSENGSPSCLENMR